MNARAIKLRSPRRRQRGAALVEAAVVMPVLTIFLGLMLFVQSEYRVKQETMIQARHDAFSKAFHADCSGSGNIGNGFPLSAPTVFGITIPIGAALGAALNWTTSTETGNGSGVAIPTIRGASQFTGPKAINSRSYTYCSPKSFSEELSSFIDSALGAAKSILPF